nr:cilia- and flagella-associated protein HOATZ isoform X2 [Anser cygnoides]
MERRQQAAVPSGAMGTEPGQCPTPPDGPLIFAGSSPADVEHARIFWNSATLPPPLESSLGPATLRQGSTALRGPLLPYKSEENSEKERISEAQNVEKTEVKEKYLQQAKKREDILALLRKQREERIAKELISHPHKPKIKADEVRSEKVLPAVVLWLRFRVLCHCSCLGGCDHSGSTALICTTNEGGRTAYTGRRCLKQTIRIKQQ